MNKIHKCGLFLLLGMMCMQPLLHAQKPCDDKATKKTRNLLYNLGQVSKTGFMFGHQDDPVYGVGWTASEKDSDVKQCVGSYPAVFGWDLGKNLKNEKNIDSSPFRDMKRWMIEVYKMGGINTISVHMDNFTSGGDAWDKTPAVADLLPGGSKHDLYKEQLDLTAAFLLDLKVGSTQIPVIFRPWHEHNGDWFWWGKGNCTEEEYKTLFRFTVDYLRNENEIHHVLYAFSPDRSRLRLDSIPVENYLYGYPGDDYVDIIGLDNYCDVGRTGSMDTKEVQTANFEESLKLITRIAADKNKVAALTETGLEGVTQTDWYTQTLLSPFADNTEIQIAWALVWRNYNATHHYAPYVGHPSEADFKAFYEQPKTYFQSDLKNPYRKNKILK
jgi:mannan endo-1,4-beta-mannosidase